MEVSDELLYNKVENRSFIENIQFDEEYECEAYDTITYYFTAPKEMLNGKYPEAESMEISVEFPVNHCEPQYASIMASPTKDGLDYDWFDMELSCNEIEQLIKKAEENTQTEYKSKQGEKNMKINELTNLWVGYNETENFRVLIVASDKEEAQEIADDYCSASQMGGNFTIKEFLDVNECFDCDYALTKS